MPRGAKIDSLATVDARNSRRFKDPRSFISTDGRIFLAGYDVRRARARVFGRDEGECITCHKPVMFDDQGYGTGFGLVMELAHLKPKSLGGDWNDLNLATKCRRCHRAADN